MVFQFFWLLKKTKPVGSRVNAVVSSLSVLQFNMVSDLSLKCLSNLPCLNTQLNSREQQHQDSAMALPSSALVRKREDEER